MLAWRVSLLWILDHFLNKLHRTSQQALFITENMRHTVLKNKDHRVTIYANL